MKTVSNELGERGSVVKLTIRPKDGKVSCCFGLFAVPNVRRQDKSTLELGTFSVRTTHHTLEHRGRRGSGTHSGDVKECQADRHH